MDQRAAADFLPFGGYAAGWPWKHFSFAAEWRNTGKRSVSFG